MSLYDTKVVRCKKCDKSIGEVEYDAEIVLAQCSKCADPLPENDDKIMYNINQIKNYRPNSIVLVKNK